MRLLYAPSSPFARKVMVLAAELRPSPTITYVETNPWTAAELRRLNPLAKIPTLVCDDGEILFESTLICEFLDTMAAGGFFPRPGPTRWPIMRLQGVADGLCAAAGRLFADEKRPDGERSATVMQRQAAAIAASLDYLEAQADTLSQLLADVGSIATACALSYLDFRWPERNWRADHPRLADWLAPVSQRPSMSTTGYRTLPT